MICAPCSLGQLGRQRESNLLSELLELRIMRSELHRFRHGCWLRPMGPEREYIRLIRRHIDDILALAPSAKIPSP